MSGELLTVATLNTRGIPLTGSQLAERYAVIGAGFDARDVDVVCCQEVFTYWHLRLLLGRMRTFRQVSYWPAPAGPAGGVVTFSRWPVSSEYLPAGATPHCIDFILTAREVKVESAALVFAEKEPIGTSQTTSDCLPGCL